MLPFQGEPDWKLTVKGNNNELKQIIYDIMRIFYVVSFSFQLSNMFYYVYILGLLKNFEN